MLCKIIAFSLEKNSLEIEVLLLISAEKKITKRKQERKYSEYFKNNQIIFFNLKERK